MDGRILRAREILRGPQESQSPRSLNPPREFATRFGFQAPRTPNCIDEVSYRSAIENSLKQESEIASAIMRDLFQSSVGKAHLSLGGDIINVLNGTPQRPVCPTGHGVHRPGRCTLQISDHTGEGPVHILTYRPADRHFGRPVYHTLI